MFGCGMVLLGTQSGSEGEMKALQRDELDMAFDACVRTLSQNSDWLASLGDYSAEDASMEELEQMIEQELLAAADDATCTVQSPKAPRHLLATTTVLGMEDQRLPEGCTGLCRRFSGHTCGPVQESALRAIHVDAANSNLLKLKQLQLQLGGVQKALADMSLTAGSLGSAIGQPVHLSSAHASVQY